MRKHFTNVRVTALGNNHVTYDQGQTAGLTYRHPGMLGPLRALNLEVGELYNVEQIGTKLNGWVRYEWTRADPVRKRQLVVPIEPVRSPLLDF